MQIQYTDEFLARFWAKVNKSGPVPTHVPEIGPCWPSSSAPTKAGYARYGLNYAVIYAHHISWMIHFGPIPEGLRVLHRCDNPPCVRPDHLFVGTQADNMEDMRSKSRGAGGESHRALMRERAARGDRNGSRTHPERLIGRTWKSGPMRPELIRYGQDAPRACLTDDQVREIRRLYALGGIGQAALAKQFGVTQSNISCIIRGKTWQHVT